MAGLLLVLAIGPVCLPGRVDISYAPLPADGSADVVAAVASAGAGVLGSVAGRVLWVEVVVGRA